MNQEDKKKPKQDCGVLNHDFKHLVRKGRANYECRRCGDNVMLLLVFAQQAGIDLTKDE